MGFKSVFKGLNVTWSFAKSCRKILKYRNILKILYVCSVHFIEFYCICRTYAQYMLTIICFFIVIRNRIFTQSTNQHMHTFNFFYLLKLKVLINKKLKVCMCWFVDWVTLLSARCKYKIKIQDKQNIVNVSYSYKKQNIVNTYCACAGHIQ